VALEHHLKAATTSSSTRKPGHYTVRPDQTGRNCFQVTRGQHDFCHVMKDEHVGEIAVKRIS
jgi:hypothetical protein